MSANYSKYPDWRLRLEVVRMRWLCRFGFVRNLALVLRNDFMGWIMGARYKLVYEGEWVRVRNLMNKYFAAARPCSVCRTFRCAMVWYNIYTKEVRCFRCRDKA